MSQRINMPAKIRKNSKQNELGQNLLPNNHKPQIGNQHTPHFDMNSNQNHRTKKYNQENLSNNLAANSNYDREDQFQKHNKHPFKFTQNQFNDTHQINSTTHKFGSRRNSHGTQDKYRYQVSKLNQKSHEIQKRSHIQSQLIAETQRIPTQQVIPSFRQKYQIYELLQQVSDQKHTIQLKNKEVFYLSNQIISIKDQFTQKIIQLEAILSQNKRQLTELRYNALKTKRLQSDKGDKVLDQLRKNYQLQIFNIKQVNQEVIKKIEEQHKKQLDNLEQKFATMLSLQKRQKNSSQQIFEQKCRNFQAIIKQLQNQNNKLSKQKQAESEQYSSLQIAADRLKQQFKIFSQKASSQQKNMHIQLQRLQSQIKRLQQANQSLRKSLRVSSDQSKRQIKQLQQTVNLYKQQSKKIKSLLIQKDKQMTKMTEINDQNSNQKWKKSSQRYVDPVRNCKHEGLIKQLEKNVHLISKENQELKTQLKYWGKYIGFNKSSEERTSQLLNASSQALQAQQSFNSTVKSKFSKFNS